MDDPVLTLMHQPQSAPPRRLDAARGVSLVLGSCSCDECAPDLVLTAWPGAWLRCVVTAHHDHWRLDNLGLDVEVMVADLENPDLRISAPPGRRQLVVPFEFSGLSFHIGPCQASDPVTVIGPEIVVEDHPACRSSLAYLSGIGVRPGTIYSAVLEELCSVARTSGAPPSSAAVARQLNQRGVRITPKAVDHHVDYLFRRLFPGSQVNPVRGYKRWALVSMMLRRAAHSTASGTSQ